MKTLCKWIQVVIILLIIAIGIDYGYDQVKFKKYSEEIPEVKELSISDEKLLEVLKTHDINILPNQGN